MSKPLVFALLMLAAPAALAQQQNQPSQDQVAEQMMRMHQEQLNRQAQNTATNFARGDHQAWLNSMANLTRLRTKLAEAWQGMGMSPQGAKVVADAYDPEWASHAHHVSLRGKTDQEVAQLMQAALKDKRFLDADQLLIDYQRQKLRLGELSSIQETH
ncbi:hypothetical protein [Frateuria sp.]|uniref:hypothetical protein n=1 Tax=Frateuria sp. TaxID=2211372 RepID=UPI0018348962|nr:hypothetical protein [Frateuria sp.]NUR24237.1 hypothetical protein [Frateuria sp.]